VERVASELTELRRLELMVLAEAASVLEHTEEHTAAHA
jgi:hypothetical protein